MSESISCVFTSYQEYLNQEQEVREDIRTTVRDIEQSAREIVIILQGIHKERGIQEVSNICAESRKKFVEIQQQFSRLANLVPDSQYYRYNDHWRYVMQRLVFLVSLIVYLESEELVSLTDVAALLQIKTKREEGFHLDLEDYLMGILQLASELSRFAVNCVTWGDYSRPLHISKFVAELSAGFRLLNLKNDSLRKRFDALKYDVKKIEEVVYDLTIRGLKSEAAPEKDGDGNV